MSKDGAEFVDSRYFPEGVPEPDPDDPLSKGFWDAAKEGRLVVQCCQGCGTLQHPPELICHQCLSFDHLSWQVMAGTGTVWSCINVVHPANAKVKERGPYNVALVQLDDHPEIRMLSNVIDVEFDELEIGMPVRVVFERTAPDLVQPRWRRAE